jgi:hypothetical protein
MCASYSAANRFQIVYKLGNLSHLRCLIIYIRDVQCCREVSERYPEIAYEEVIIDNCCMMVSCAAWLSPKFGPHPGWRCCRPSSLARTQGAFSEGRHSRMPFKVDHVRDATEECDELLADSYTKSLLLA